MKTPHRGDDGRRVDPTGEKDAERNVGDQVAADRFVDEFSNDLDCLVLRPDGGVRFIAELPVALEADRSLLGDEHCPGQKFAGVAENRRRRRHVGEAQVVVEGLVVDRAVESGCEEALQLGAEKQPPAAEGVMERLDAEAIARDHEAALPRVPEREGEHAAQPGGAARSELLVEMDDDLGVAVRREAMTTSLEIAPQLLEVVYLPVEDDRDRTVLVGNRLVPAREVDDRETTHAHRQWSIDVEALVVGASVDDDVAHRAGEVPGRGDARVEREESGDATHGSIAFV